MFIESNKGKIAADHIDCGGNTPLLIIFHGRGGHRNTAAKRFAEYLKDFNISSLRVDLFGYGESDGRFEDITITTAKDTVLETVKYAKENLEYSKLFLFGTSYGGNGILGALPDLSPEEISGIIFRSTILNYLKKTEREYSKEALEEWKNNGYINDSEGKLNYSFVEDMKNYTNIDSAKLAEFETLYFHGGKDTKVLTAEVEELKSKSSEKFNLIIYPNSTHGIDIQEDFDDMLVKTKEFIQKTIL